MTVGDELSLEVTELPCALTGTRLWRLACEAGRCYVPYFYNSPLDPAGRLLAITERDGTEQAYLLDCVRRTATQLTAARGQNQHWSPYIRAGVAGIRPQFVCWSQPDWEHVLYWEENDLHRVNVVTLVDEILFTLEDDQVPQAPHCAANGLVAWGYLPTVMQRRFREGASVATIPALRDELSRGCGFMLYDLGTRQLDQDVPTPFWVNHVQASPDGQRVLFAQEAPWRFQRMHLLDRETGQWGPLRVQDDGAAIGHEFWMSATQVGYHGHYGDQADRGFFGAIDVVSGVYQERPSAIPARYYGHYHTSPDGRFVVTDGEVTPDSLSLAPLAEPVLHFTPVCRHGWARDQDQRYHPHPHWHASGRWITCTGTRTLAGGSVTTDVLLLDLAPAGGDPYGALATLAPRQEDTRMPGMGSPQANRRDPP
jgi:hypothetical protein